MPSKPSSTFSLRFAAIGGALGMIVFVAGCSDSAGERHLPPPARPSGELTATTAEAVVAGATNVSNGILTNSTFQGETAAAGNGPYQLVAYNADDTLHEGNGNERCLNYAEFAFSYNSNNTWRAMRMPIPSGAGIAMLRGDPGASAVDMGTNSVFLLSTMAVTTTAFNAAFKQPDGCVSLATFPTIDRTRLCYTAVVVPKDGSAAFFYGAQCVQPANGTDPIDGTTAYADMQNGVFNAYVAYWNTRSNAVDVFKNGAALPNPFPGKSILGHTVFIQHVGNVPTIVAPDSAGHFWLARLNEGASSWVVVQMTDSNSPGYNWNATTQLGDGTFIRTGLYNGDNYNTGFADNLIFFYPTQRRLAQPGANLKTVQVGVLCGLLGSAGGTCTVQSGLQTSAETNAIYPSVAVANVNNGSAYYPAVTFWTDTIGGGTLTLNVATINASSFTWSIGATRVSQVPCVYQDYWGDYDGMAVYNNGSSLPLLVRYFSDSTGGTCNNGLPQHVSEYTMLP